MSTPVETPPPFFLPPFPVPGGNNVVGICPQMPTQLEEFGFHPFKKPRNFDDVPANPIQNQLPIPSMLSPPVPPPNPLQNPSQNNKMINRLFFKTRLCAKFRLGSCPYGNNCNFAHGPEDLRRAPPNWQDILAAQDGDRMPGNMGDQHRIHKPKICRKFYSGEGCPYGDRCTFVHVEPGNFRESSAISVGTTEKIAPVTGIFGSGFDNPEINDLTGSSGDGNVPSQKTSFWKTRMCHKWETTGNCPFGEKCVFAHGVAELKKVGGHIDVDGNSGVAPPKNHPNPAVDVSVVKMEPNCKHQPRQKGFLRWKGFKKINRIYADWIDDMPLCSSDKSET